MNTGMEERVVIHNVSRKEFMDAIEKVATAITDKVRRREYQLHEVADLTGYSIAHVRKLVHDNGIPFRKTGKSIWVTHENLSLFPVKRGKSQLSDYQES
jgi:excisionase family DNA binding protein